MFNANEVLQTPGAIGSWHLHPSGGGDSQSLSRGGDAESDEQAGALLLDEFGVVQVVSLIVGARGRTEAARGFFALNAYLFARLPNGGVTYELLA